MINPLTAQLLPPVSDPNKNARSSDSAAPEETRDHGTPSPRAEHAGLAASITADGGLGFLRSRLEETMGALFEKATEDAPGAAAGGPASFFDANADVSPEATADRIVGFALGLRQTFSRQNPELEQDELMTRFEAEVRRGISEGFGHARGTLGDLELYEGEIEQNVDQTWDLVQQKLAEFFESQDPEQG